MLNIHRLASQTMCVWGRITNGHVHAACAQFSHVVLAAMASQRTNRSLTKSDISCMELKLASLVSANNCLRLEDCGVNKAVIQEIPKKAPKICFACDSSPDAHSRGSYIVVRARAGWSVL